MRISKPPSFSHPVRHFAASSFLRPNKARIQNSPQSKETVLPLIVSPAHIEQAVMFNHDFHQRRSQWFEKKWRGGQALGVAALCGFTACAFVWNFSIFREPVASKYLYVALLGWAVSTFLDLKFINAVDQPERRDSKPGEMARSTMVGAVYLTFLLAPFAYSLKLGVLSILVKSLIIFSALARQGRQGEVWRPSKPLLLEFLGEDFFVVQDLLRTMVRAHPFLFRDEDRQSIPQAQEILVPPSAIEYLQDFLKRDYAAGLGFLQSLIEKSKPNRAAFIAVNRENLRSLEERIAVSTDFMTD